MQRYYFIWNNRITFFLSVLLQQKFTFLSFFQFFLQLTGRSFNFNARQLTVSNNGLHWILYSGPDSVVFSVKGLDENITISSREMPLAAWSLLLSQRQEVLDNHWPRVPITPNQRGTFDMREKVLSSVWSTRYRHEGIGVLRSRRH